SIGGQIQVTVGIGAGSGKMREDFFFRVHILPISLPALRQRREDIPLLVDYYLSRFCEPEPKPVLPVNILEALYNYDWPGNIRELQNVLRRYLATSRLDFLPLSSTTVTTTPAPPEKPAAGRTLSDMVANYEKNIIMQTLEANRWHRGKTAAALGIDRKTLFVKMKIFGLP
ncbi:MAG: sigma-54-dependent Fis family transcriptional regulator, partial [Deltaproteobacteria bacterium]|nr:sigma-54-dependent Fis family transcriptional regulator [Deltaproteobacteria bacterium]